MVNADPSSILTTYIAALKVCAYFWEVTCDTNRLDRVHPQSVITTSTP